MSENEEIEYFNLGNREKVNSINKNNEKNIKVYQEIFENIINNLNKEYDINIENCKLENLKINSLNCLKTNLKNTIELIIKNKLEKENKQLKKSILNLEQGKRYFIQQYFLKKTKIDMLENEIEAYMEMEDEFEEMKIKFKYDDGEFLKNERKENEILILRAENSNLKGIIEKYEKIIQEKEEKINKLQKKIKELENTKDSTLSSEKENKSSNISKSKENNTIKQLSSITRRINNYSQRTINENYSKENNKKTNHRNNKSASISINSNNKVKKKNKNQKHKKNSNIVLNMKQVRQCQKSKCNLIGSPFNKSFNNLIKSSLNSTLSKHSTNNSNINNVKINYNDYNNNNNENKKSNITNPNNSKIKIPFNKEDLILLRYKNRIKSPTYSSKSQNNSNILYNIINNFPSTSRSKYKQNIMDGYVNHNFSLSKRDLNQNSNTLNAGIVKKNN